METENKSDELSLKGILFILVFTGVVVLMVWGYVKSPTHGSQERAKTQLGSDKLLPKKTWRDEDNSIMAYIMMQHFVKRRLKAPSTAKFEGLWSGREVTKDSTEYSTYSYVDAQNGYGAMLRTSFTCTVKQVSEDDWHLVSLQGI